LLRWADRCLRQLLTVIVLPFLKLVVGQMDIVADAILVEQLVKLLLIDTVGALDLAVQTRGSRADVDVPDVLLLQVPVEGSPVGSSMVEEPMPSRP
jgi:hypothetical protein